MLDKLAGAKPSSTDYPAMGPSNPPPHLSFSHLAKAYETREGRFLAIGDVTLNIARGEFVSIVGPSGCGKSSLLKIVLGLSSYSGGEARLDGRLIAGPQQSAGMVFQTPALPPWRSVLDNVLLPIELLGKRRSDYEKRARELLAIAGLADFERKLPHELSGGMQQRVSICRALIHDPELLLMDEPFGALDALTREVMQGQLLKIWAETKKTVVFVTHSIDEAVIMSDRVIVMSGRPSSVLEDIKIDIPRPRKPYVRTLPEFQAHAQSLRRLLGVS